MHHPPHIYLDNTYYITTSATFNHAPFMTSNEAKAFIRDAIKSLVQEFRIKLHAWVILDNHYHLLFKTHHGKDISRFFGRLHGSSSRQINLWDKTPGRTVWHNYWDSCIRTEQGFWVRFNYIHNNPIKHGYVRRIEAWPFSSYHYYLRTKGQEWLDDCWLSYPVIDFLEGDI